MKWKVVIDEETRAELERYSEPAPPVDPKYVDWIADYVARTPILLGRCKEAVTEMAEAFPELKKVPGHVYTMQWGQRGHWWCTAPNGAVVDPTASQFPLILAYEDWRPGTEVRCGRCMECGTDLYAAVDSLDEAPPRRDMCDASCAAAFERSMG